MEPQTLDARDVQPTCPQCGKPMRLRNGQFGAFYGCSGYPQCRKTFDAAEYHARQESGLKETSGHPQVVGSPEQEAIWQTLQNEDCHVVVKALAGTGKSFTCREAMHRLPSTAKVLYLAFNKEIVKEFAPSAPRNAEVKTLNAQGFRVVKSAFPDGVVDPQKTQNLLAEIYSPKTPEELRSFRGMANAVEKLVALAQGYLLDGTNPEELLEVAARHDVELEADFVEQALALTPRLLQLTKERPAVVSYNDQLWLPVVLHLPCPKYDVIFVDEAQDLNRLQHELVLKLLAPQGRVVVVGDDNQAIYGFRGSDVDSINNFTRLLEDTQKPIRSLPLTVTRRCPIRVVEAAQEFVPELRALPDAKEGRVVYTTTQEAERLYTPGDLVLCRCNAPLVGVAYGLIRRGVPAVIRGRDIGQGLVVLVQKLRARDLNDLLLRLDRWEQRERGKVAGTRREEQATAQIMDRADCIRALAENVDSISELCARISALFDNVSPRGAVILSSIHRAKGLEADRVIWLLPEIEVKASQEWQQRQENNLRYVAITRAKRELVMATEGQDGYEEQQDDPQHHAAPEGPTEGFGAALVAALEQRGVAPATLLELQDACKEDDSNPLEALKEAGMAEDLVRLCGLYLKETADNGKR